MPKTKLPLKSEADIVTARMEARQIAKQIGFNTVDQARIAMAASELARLVCDTVHYSSELILSQTDQDTQHGMQVICLVNMIANDVSSSGTGIHPPVASSVLSAQLKFRRSLASVSRLVDESSFNIDEAGQVSVTLIKWSH